MSTVSTTDDALLIEGTLQRRENIATALEMYGNIISVDIIKMKHSEYFGPIDEDYDISVLVCSNDHNLVLGKPRFIEYFKFSNYLATIVTTYLMGSFPTYHVFIMYPVISSILNTVNTKGRCVMELPKKAKRHKCINCKKKKKVEMIVTWNCVVYMCYECIEKQNKLMGYIPFIEEQKNSSSKLDYGKIKEKKMLYVPPTDYFQQSFRDTVDKLHSNKIVPYCKICGDTQEDGELLKIVFTNITGSSYMCRDCYTIQKNMPPVIDEDDEIW